MRLMTNNPAKFTGLKGYGLAVVGRVPVVTPITKENRRYMERPNARRWVTFISLITISLWLDQKLLIETNTFEFCIYN